MAEFRTDPLRGHTVLINGQRGRRPSEFSLKIETPDPADCPFCRGHEFNTPPSIEYDLWPDWNWRVFPNRFPAVMSDPQSVIVSEFTAPAFGQHEVLVESAQHDGKAHEYSAAHWEELFRVWQRRLRSIYAMAGIQYVHIFRNQGYRGGATLVHPHQQIVGLPMLPTAIEWRLNRLADGTSVCTHCEWVEHERRSGQRVLWDDGELIGLAAFAPRFPYEWQLLPCRHERFDELSADKLSSVAGNLLRGLRALAAVCDEPDFNLLLFSTPLGFPGRPVWTLDVLPRTSTQAGFEWGTGVHIVSTPPEEAGSRLRDSGAIRT